MHIKEHVWSIRACPATVLLSAMSECACECSIEGPNDRGIASYEMAGLYAPQGVDLGGGGSPSKKHGMTQYEKWPKQQNFKVTFENVQKSQILNALYKCTEMKMK